MSGNDNIKRRIRFSLRTLVLLVLASGALLYGLLYFRAKILVDRYLAFGESALQKPTEDWPGLSELQAILDAGRFGRSAILSRLDSPNPVDRALVLQVVDSFPDGGPILISMLDDPAPIVRFYAVYWLIGKDVATTAIPKVEPFLKSKSADLRRIGLQFLSHYPSRTPECIPIIADLLTDPNRDIAFKAAEVLRSYAETCPDRFDSEIFLEMCRVNEDLCRRWRIGVRFFSDQAGRMRACKPVAVSLLDDPDKRTVVMAARALRFHAEKCPKCFDRETVRKMDEALDGMERHVISEKLLNAMRFLADGQDNGRRPSGAGEARHEETEPKANE